MPNKALQRTRYRAPLSLVVRIMKTLLKRLMSEFMARPEAIWETTVARCKYLPVIALVLTLLVGGFSTIRALWYLQSFAASPANSDLFSTYHGETPLFFLLAHALGATTLPRYLVFCGCIVIVVYSLVYNYANRRKSPPAMLCLLLFASHPIAYILQTWFGMVDGLTVASTAVLLFSRSTVAMAPASLVLMLNHTSAPLIALPLLILRILSGDSVVSLRHFCVVAISLLIGKILLISFLGVDIESASRLGFIFHVPLSHWVRINITHLPLIVYSMFFALWIPIIFMVVLFFNDNRRFYGCYLLFLAGFYCVTLVTLDTTRVYAMLSWGPTLCCLMHTWDKTAERTIRNTVFRACVVASAFLGWCLPRLFVYDGKVYAPGLDQPIKLIWDILQGSFSL